MPLLGPVSALAGAFAVVWMAGRMAGTRALRLPPWLDTALDHRLAPAVAGVLTAAIVWWVWGSLGEPGIIHDERAYLLQAQIFATGHWTGRVPPLHEFFEQMHVFVVPRLAAKYPPGHSLLLTPGIWAGLPGLMPVLFTGVAGALVFALARRLADSVTALLAWSLWATSTPNLFWRASYLSQTTSALLWLLAAWFTLRWMEERKISQAACIAAALAWMYLTRPLSALALGLPLVACAVLTGRVRRAHLVVGGLVACPILLLNLVWHERTLGSWSANPYSEYSRIYFPFDKPGFGLDMSAAVEPPPAEMAAVGQEFLNVHAEHRVERLPLILLERIVAVLLVLGSGWRAAMIVLFALGSIKARRGVLVAVASMASLIAAYLAFAHPPTWTLYYVEAFPVFFLLVGCELAQILRTVLGLPQPQVRAATALLVAVTLPFLVSDVAAARRAHDQRAGFHRTAEKVLATIPQAPSVVFVHYPRSHDHNFALISNSPDYARSKMWVVYDRGVDNERLLKLTDRAAYRLYTEDWRIERLR